MVVSIKIINEEALWHSNSTSGSSSSAHAPINRGIVCDGETLEATAAPVHGDNAATSALDHRRFRSQRGDRGCSPQTGQCDSQAQEPRARAAGRGTGCRCAQRGPWTQMLSEPDPGGRHCSWGRGRPPGEPRRGGARRAFPVTVLSALSKFFALNVFDLFR